MEVSLSPRICLDTSTFRNLSALPRHLPATAPVPLRPNPTAPRSQNPIRIQRVLELLVELHQSAIVPVIRPCNLVHEDQVRTVLSVSQRGSIIDHGAEAAQRGLPPLGIRPKKHNLDDEMHLPQTHAERGEQINPVFGMPLLGKNKKQRHNHTTDGAD